MSRRLYNLIVINDLGYKTTQTSNSKDNHKTQEVIVDCRDFYSVYGIGFNKCEIADDVPQELHGKFLSLVR